MANAQLYSDEVSNNKTREAGIISYQVFDLDRKKEKKRRFTLFLECSECEGPKAPASFFLSFLYPFESLISHA